MKYYVLFFLTSCVSLFAKDLPGYNPHVISLANSVHIIRTLIHKNQLHTFLENCTQEDCNLLINNFSPAQMALEAEVLSPSVPLTVVYFFQSNKNAQEYIKQLEIYAKKCSDIVKFVTIDAEKLFSIAQDAQIKVLPTVLFMRNREIIDQVEGEVPMNNLQKRIQYYLQEKNHHTITCQEPWFSLLKDGTKPVEGRKNSAKYQTIKEGDSITFVSENNKHECFDAEVTEVRRYPSLKDYLNDVGIKNAVPGVETMQDACAIYHQWSTPEEIKEHGFLGIFVEPTTL